MRRYRAGSAPPDDRDDELAGLCNLADSHALATAQRPPAYPPAPAGCARCRRVCACSRCWWPRTCPAPAPWWWNSAGPANPATAVTTARSATTARSVRQVARTVTARRAADSPHESRSEGPSPSPRLARRASRLTLASTALAPPYFAVARNLVQRGCCWSGQGDLRITGNPLPWAGRSNRPFMLPTAIWLLITTCTVPPVE
jgi:hypothetical protein